MKCGVRTEFDILHAYPDNFLQYKAFQQIYNILYFMCTFLFTCISLNEAVTILKFTHRYLYFA
jgi:hypothetical protein